MACSSGSGSGGGVENVVGLEALINSTNRFRVIDFPRPSPAALYSFSTGDGPLGPLWRVSVENPRLLLFLLDDGGGLLGSA